MRVLLTGATGFIGSYVLRRFLSSGEHEVAVLLRRDSDPWRIRELVSGAARIEGSLDALHCVEPEVRKFAADTVVHLAWSGVENCCRNDVSQIDNIGRGVELLKLIHGCGARCFVGLGSQAEYGPCMDRISEDHPTRPTTFYGVAKLCAFLLGRRLSEEFGMRFAWVRLSSSFGPKDWQGWMIPQLILTLLKGERPVLTKGDQLWDYIYVEDVAEAIYAVASAGKAEGAFNLGSGRVCRIRDIAERIRDLVDPSLELGFGDEPYRPDQVFRLEPDISRLRKSTGWTPHISIEDGLARTVEWYRENRQHYDS